MLLARAAKGKGPFARLSVRMSSSWATVPFFQVDSFASAPFSGNPAAVLLLDNSARLSDTSLARIAAENNLSETSFVWPRYGASSDHVDEYDLRWFTPTKEIALCGHGTLAAAAAVLSHETTSTSTSGQIPSAQHSAAAATSPPPPPPPPSPPAASPLATTAAPPPLPAAPPRRLTFHTLSGPLVASLIAPTPPDSPVECPTIELDFPSNVPEVLPDEPQTERDRALRELAEVVLSESGCALPVEALVYCSHTRKLIVHCAGGGDGDAASTIEGLCVPAPERLLAAHDGSLVTGVSLLATGGCGEHADADFTSRYFAPVM